MRERQPILRVSAVGILLLVVGGCTTPQESVDRLSAGDLAKLRELNLAYPAAWVEADSSRILDLFLEDAVLQPHHGVAPVVGKPAMREHFWPTGSGWFRVTAYEMTPTEIAGVPDLAYARGRFAISFEFESGADTVRLSNAGNYLMLFEPDTAGAWKIARYIWNDPPPEEI